MCLVCPSRQGRFSAMFCAGVVLLRSARGRKVSQHPVWAWLHFWGDAPIMCSGRASQSSGGSGCLYHFLFVLGLLCCACFAILLSPVLCAVFILPCLVLLYLFPANGWSFAPCLGLGLCHVWAGQACSGRPLVFHVSGPVWVTAVLVAAARVILSYHIAAEVCVILSSSSAAEVCKWPAGWQWPPYGTCCMIL